jgi:uncharacterized protein YllA (UPF0747 family)
VAYFAQAAAAYEVLDCPMPPIYPRISATILEPRIGRIMEKYGVELPDVFQGREFLKRKCVATIYDVEQFSRVRDRVEEELQSLRGLLGEIDATLPGALNTTLRKSIYQIESLRTRYIHAAARRDQTVERHLDGMGNSLFPERKFQERLLNMTSFLVRYGVGMVRRLDESLALDSRQHQLIEI